MFMVSVFVDPAAAHLHKCLVLSLIVGQSTAHTNQTSQRNHAFQQILSCEAWERVLPDATFKEATLSFTVLCKDTFSPLLAVLVTLFCIISMSSVASVMAKLHPVSKKLSCIVQKINGSSQHL